MGSISEEKPHAVMVPYPAQCHVNPMMKLRQASPLQWLPYHLRQHTEFNHKRLLWSKAPHAVDVLRDFCYETIPDSLHPSDTDATQHVPSLCHSTSTTCVDPFVETSLPPSELCLFWPCSSYHPRRFR